MQTLRMAKWPEDSGLVHESSSWQISNTPDFEQILLSAKEDQNFLDIYYANIIVPSDSIYYARSRRIFEGGTVSDWLGPVELFPAEPNTTLDIKPEVVIENPYVFLDKDKVINVNEDSITLTGGSFRCDTDGHLATTWILTDSAGRVIYSSMYNTTDKKEHIVKKTDVNLSNTTTLTLSVFHTSSNGFESNCGTMTINLNEYKFNITSNLSSISPYNDYELTFQLLVGTYAEYPLLNVDIVDMDGRVVFTQDLVDENAIIVPRAILKGESTYTVKFYQKDLDGVPVEFKMFTTGYTDIFKVDPNYLYRETYMDTGMEITIEDQCVSEQLVDNGIPVPYAVNHEVGLYVFRKRDYTLGISTLARMFLNRAGTINGGQNFKMIDGDTILIDRMVDDGSGGEEPSGVPEFTIYNYKGQILERAIRREDEIATTAKQNNLVINEQRNTAFYIADTVSGAVFRSLDLTTGEITDLQIRPNLVNADATLCSIGNGKMLSFNGGSDNLAYTFDIEEELWTDVTAIPDTHIGTPMSTFLRKDGNVICFSVGEGQNDPLVFDVTTNRFSVITNPYSNSTELDSTLRLRNGTFLRYKSGAVPSPVYLFR